MKPNTRSHGELKLLLGSVVLCLGAGELAMRWLHPLHLLPAATSSTRKSELYGWAAEPDQLLSQVDPDSGQVIESRANSQGWRDVEHAFAKPPDRVRIVFVGDSFTYGSVPLEAVYTRRVEALLRARGEPVEVISMGVGGWGPDQELEALRNEGVRYAPDVVVYQFCSNDIINIDPPPQERGDMSLGTHKPFRYLVRDGKLLRLDWASVDARRHAGSLAGLRALLRRSALLRMAGTLVSWDDEASAVPDPRSDRITESSVVARFGSDEVEKHWWKSGWELFEALVGEMDAVSSAHGARFVVFSEAGEPGMRNHLLANGQLRTEAGADFVALAGRRAPVDMLLPLRNVAAVCERGGIPLIAPKRTYERFRSDWHTNRAGNENMAADIVDFLEAWPVYQQRLRAARAAGRDGS